MIAKVSHFVRHLRLVFFNGPAVFNYPGKKITGYRSINVMITYWFHAFSVLYFTQAGRILTIGLVYFIMGSMLTLLMPVYYLAITLASLLIVNIVLGWILRPRLHIERHVPDNAPANTPIQINYTIENNYHRPAWDIAVDAIPLQGAIRMNKARTFLKAVQPYERINVTNEIIASRRGSYQLPLPVAASAFPFGLWRWSSSGKPTKAILVYPDYTPLTHVALPLDYAHHAAGAESYSAAAAQSMEFRGCREFRYGDSPRLIHAPSWARLQKPVVKEFSDEHSKHVAIFADTFLAGVSPLESFFRKPNRQFEAAMALTAAIADYLLRKEYQIDLFTIDEDGLTKRNRTGGSDVQEFMEIIASLNYTKAVPAKQFPREYHAILESISTAIIIVLDWDDSRESIAREIMDRGIALKTIIIAEKPALTSDPADAGALISPEEILAGNVREI